MAPPILHSAVRARRARRGAALRASVVRTILYDMTVRRRRTRRSVAHGPRKPESERKDYLIQARVPRELDDVLKKEAKRRRLSVSHLIRNVLEDTYKLVDNVIVEVDNIVQDSVELSGRLRRDAREIARSMGQTRAQEGGETSEPARPATSARGQERAEAPATPPRAHERADASAAGTRGRGAAPAAAQDKLADSFDALTADIYAWNAVVLHRGVRCIRCERALERGATAHLGISQQPTATPRWLCGGCLERLSADADS